MKILIVEDMLPNAIFLDALVRKLPGAATHICASGEDALVWCRGNVPDVVVTDHIMPGMSGVELITALRAERQGEFIPVLMLTADVDKSVLYEAFEAGATDFLRKPFDEIELRARISNMMALRRQHLELERLATTDPLTTVLNRRSFMMRLEAEVRRCSRYGSALTVMMLDIDHFKRINDTYGHAAGDLALQVFSRSVEGVVRDSDCFGRLGGEEFALILPEIGTEEALVLGARLLAAVSAARVDVPPDTFGFTTSIGLSAYAGGDAEALLKRADGALYAAKTAGRNRLACATM